MKRGRHTLRTPPHNLNRKHIGPRQQSESCSTCKDAEMSATTEKHRHSQVVGCVYSCVDPRKGPDSGVRPSYKVIPKYPFPRLPSAKSSAGASWYRSSSSAPSLPKSELSIVCRSSSAVTRRHPSAIHLSVPMKVKQGSLGRTHSLLPASAIHVSSLPLVSCMIKIMSKQQKQAGR